MDENEFIFYQFDGELDCTESYFIKIDIEESDCNYPQWTILGTSTITS